VSDLRVDLPVRVVTTGLGPLIVPLRDEAALRKARRADSGLIKDLCDASGAFDLYPFAVRGPGHVVARMFDWSDEIGEDPATGSAAGPLGAYMAEHGLAGMPGRCVVAQGEQTGRPSFLHVDVARSGEGWSVRVGGGVQAIGSGTFEF
jgi:trans-2,3-dihydro-3-hydroxyanthranilate isomerase